MLKNVEKCNIILHELRWNYMNNSVLISTAMLNALWESKQKDMLDLLIPFLKYSIYNTTKVGDKIDIKKVSDYFVSEHGYDTIPTGVIVTMMNRLSPTYLKKQKNNYYLTAHLDEECQKFNNKRDKFKQQSLAVINALQDYLNSTLFGFNLDEDQAFKALMDFFVINGICLVKDKKMLEALKSKDSKINYAIAQFIIHEEKSTSVIYEYISQMVGGFFVSTALSLQPQNGSLVKSKYKDLVCYLDTRIILCALGLHLTEETYSARELIKMLQAENAVIKCFHHTYREVYDIICAYKAGLQYPRKSKNTQTLENWDEYKYSVSDIDTYLLMLPRKIEGLGITIESKSPYDDQSVVDKNTLYNFLNANIIYRNKEGLSKDIDSITSICRLRDGYYSNEIEKCKYIFITTNIKLAHFANKFLSNEIGSNVPPVITDINMSSITWLKSYSTNKNYPSKKLLSNALASAEPSSAMIISFLDKVDKINNEGGITDDEAAIIRSDLFCRREANRIAMGDPSAVSDKTIFDIRDKVKKDYLNGEESKAQVNYEKYKAALEMKNEPIRNALNEIERTRNTSQKACCVISYTIVAVIAIGIMGIILHNLISGFLGESEINIYTILGAIIEAAGVIDLFVSKRSLIKKMINKISFLISAKITDIKRGKYEKIFPDFCISKIE